MRWKFGCQLVWSCLTDLEPALSDSVSSVNPNVRSFTLLCFPSIKSVSQFLGLPKQPNRPLEPEGFSHLGVTRCSVYIFICSFLSIAMQLSPLVWNFIRINRNFRIAYFSFIMHLKSTTPRRMCSDTLIISASYSKHALVRWVRFSNYANEISINRLRKD